MQFLILCAMFSFPFLVSAIINDVVVDGGADVENLLLNDLIPALKNYSNVLNKNYTSEINGELKKINEILQNKLHNLNNNLQNMRGYDYFTADVITVDNSLSNSFVENVNIYILENDLMITLTTKEYYTKIDELLNKLRSCYKDNNQECVNEISSKTIALKSNIVRDTDELINLVSLIPNYIKERRNFYQKKAEEDLDFQYKIGVESLSRSFYDYVLRQIEKYENIIKDEQLSVTLDNSTLSNIESIKNELKQILLDGKAKIKNDTNLFLKGNSDLNTTKCVDHETELEKFETKYLQHTIDLINKTVKNFDNDIKSSTYEISEIIDKINNWRNGLNNCTFDKYYCFYNIYEYSFKHRNCNNYYRYSTINECLSEKMNSISSKIKSKRNDLIQKLRNLLRASETNSTADLKVLHNNFKSCLTDHNSMNVSAKNIKNVIDKIEQKLHNYNNIIRNIDARNLYTELSQIIREFKSNLQKKVDLEQRKFPLTNDNRMCIKNKVVFDNLVTTHAVQVEYNSINEIINNVQNEINTFKPKFQEQQSLKRLLNTYWSSCQLKYNTNCLTKVQQMIENNEKSMDLFTKLVDDTKLAIDMITTKVQQYEHEETISFNKNLQQILNETYICIKNVEYTTGLRNKIAVIKNTIELGNKIAELFKENTFEKETQKIHKEINETLTESLKIFKKIQNIVINKNMNITETCTNNDFKIDDNLLENCLDMAQTANSEIITTTKNKYNFTVEALDKYLGIVQNDVQFDLENCNNNSTCLENINNQLDDIKYNIASLIEGPKKLILDTFEANKIKAITHCNNIGDEFVYCMLTNKKCSGNDVIMNLVN